MHTFIKFQTELDIDGLVTETADDSNMILYS